MAHKVGHCSKCGQPVATACSLCWALFCFVCDIGHKQCEKPKELESSFDPVDEDEKGEFMGCVMKSELVYGRNKGAKEKGRLNIHRQIGGENVELKVLTKDLKVGDLVILEEIGGKKTRVRIQPSSLDLVLDVVSQQLPRCEPTEVHADKSTIKATQGHCPKRFSTMGNILQIARNFSPGGRPSGLPQLLEPSAFPFTTKEDVAAAWQINIGNLLNSCGFGYNQSPAAVGATIGSPDRVSSVVRDGRQYVTCVVELKAPWSLTAMPKSGREVASMYTATLTSQAAEGETTEETRRCVQAISRTIGHMLDNKAQCGALSCYTYTWFLIAKSAEEFYVSDAFHNSDKDALRCWAFFISRASVLAPLRVPPGFVCSPSARVKPKKTRQKSTGNCPRKKRRKGDEDEDEDADEDQFVGKQHSALPVAQGPTTRAKANEIAAGRGGGDTTTTVQQVHWGSLELLKMLGDGRCGKVMAAKHGADQVALKLFTLDPQTSKAFAAELECYNIRLRAVQGVAVPKLLFTTNTYSELTVGLGLELGEPLPKRVAEWSEPQRRAAFESLRVVADECGVAQLDLREENFVQSAAEPGRVLVVDWEESEVLATKKQKLEYLRSAAHFLGQDTAPSRAPTKLSLKRTRLAQ